MAHIIMSQNKFGQNKYGIHEYTSIMPHIAVAWIETKIVKNTYFEKKSTLESFFNADADADAQEIFENPLSIWSSVQQESYEILFIFTLSYSKLWLPELKWTINLLLSLFGFAVLLKAARYNTWDKMSHVLLFILLKFFQINIIINSTLLQNMNKSPK